MKRKLKDFDGDKVAFAFFKLGYAEGLADGKTIMFDKMIKVIRGKNGNKKTV